MTTQMYMMLVPPSLPVKTVKELVAYARNRPGALSYGSQGLGTTGHLGMERFKRVAGVDIVHVPYKGAAPAMLDLLSGQIHLLFASTIASAPHVKSGKLRALAVTGESRNPAYPELPTVAESGVPGFRLTNKYNLFAPAGTPRPIVLAVNQTVSRGMNSPDMMKILAADGAQAAAPTSPEAFKELFAKEYAEAEKLVSALNLRLN
jgi:tripartite-type tricarboxylate transporter receptor subunit TctC